MPVFGKLAHKIAISRFARTFAALLNELGADGSYLTIEDVFADMARTFPALAGLNLSKIGDLGVELKVEQPATKTEQPLVSQAVGTKA